MVGHLIERQRPQAATISKENLMLPVKRIINLPAAAQDSLLKWRTELPVLPPIATKENMRLVVERWLLKSRLNTAPEDSRTVPFPSGKGAHQLWFPTEFLMPLRYRHLYFPCRYWHENETKVSTAQFL